MKLNKRETAYLVSLIKVDVGMIGFLNGFAGLSKHDREKKYFCENIINKLLGRTHYEDSKED
jgi:hypothetical protein